MKNKNKDDALLHTSNLYLASAIVTAGYPLVSLEGNFPNRAIFVFRKTAKLTQVINAFHAGTLNLPAKQLLYGQKELKDRLWEESRL